MAIVVIKLSVAYSSLAKWLALIFKTILLTLLEVRDKFGFFLTCPQ